MGRFGWHGFIGATKSMALLLLVIAIQALASARVLAVEQAPHPDAPALDDLLSGLDAQCSASPSLEAFRSALRDVDGDRYPLTPEAAKSQLDAPLRSAIGAIRILEETADYQLIQVDVVGTWRGVPVEGLVFWLGKSNGILSLVVIFSPPHGPALDAFETRISASAKRMAEDPENLNAASTGIQVEAERVQVWCDWSN